MTRERQAAVEPDRWLQPEDVDPGAARRLFMFHHSGGSTTLYRQWLPMLPTDVAGTCVQLPGRHERRGEEPFTELDPLIATLMMVFATELDDRPYAFFGHSMGALIAYRLAVSLRRAGIPGPTVLAVSGWAPEGFRSPTDLSGRNSDDQIAAGMRDLGSLPDQIEADPQQLALTVRLMRADSATCASYQDDGAEAGCPIVSYSGQDDQLLAPEGMLSWRSRTPAYLGNRVFPGGHFFVHQHRLAIMTDLIDVFRRCTRDEPPAPFPASPAR